MFPPYVCSARMCHSVARGFMNKIRQKFTKLNSLKRKKKIHKFPCLLKYKRLCEPRMCERQQKNIIFL